MSNYCFVLDSTEKQLSPTSINKAWYLIRKNKACLINKYPMVIKLNREIDSDEIENGEIVCGIDDGSKHVGIAIITKHKILFKGVIELRQDVKHLMDLRKRHRQYRRSHKRYRIKRYNNRSSSRRTGRIPPSIKQKKDSILRIVNKLNKWIKITKIVLEDVEIDIRVLQEGSKLLKGQHQKSNRLDENLRKAAIIRDGYKCMECGKKSIPLEVHHIVPKRLKGTNTICNLITLCKTCHSHTFQNEEQFISKYQQMVEGENVRTDHAQHVMQGKKYLRNELSKIAELELTTGSDTANSRIYWCIPKSHSNDALIITGIDMKGGDYNVSEWTIRPMRKKKKNKQDGLLGFKHRDLVKYTKKNGDSYVGWITAIYPEKKQCNITTIDGTVLKRYGLKNLKKIWRFSNIYWLNSDILNQN
jgi:hypothetical protein